MKNIFKSHIYMYVYFKYIFDGVIFLQLFLLVLKKSIFRTNFEKHTALEICFLR